MDDILSLSKYTIKRAGGFNYNFEFDGPDGKKVIDAKAKGLGYNHFLLYDVSGKPLGEVKRDSNWTLRIGPIPVAGAAISQLTNFADMTDAAQTPICSIKHDKSVWPLLKYLIIDPSGKTLAIANAQGLLVNDVEISGPSGSGTIARLSVPKVDGILNKLKEGSAGLMELDILDNKLSRMPILGFSLMIAGSRLEQGGGPHPIK